MNNPEHYLIIIQHGETGQSGLLAQPNAASELNPVSATATVGSQTTRTALEPDKKTESATPEKNASLMV